MMDDEKLTQVDKDILNSSCSRAAKEELDIDQFIMPDKRGELADEYIKELRENDRIT